MGQQPPGVDNRSSRAVVNDDSMALSFAGAWSTSAAIIPQRSSSRALIRRPTNPSRLLASRAPACLRMSWATYLLKHLDA